MYVCVYMWVCVCIWTHNDIREKININIIQHKPCILQHPISNIAWIGWNNIHNNIDRCNNHKTLYKHMHDMHSMCIWDKCIVGKCITFHNHCTTNIYVCLYFYFFVSSFSSHHSHHLCKLCSCEYDEHLSRSPIDSVSSPWVPSGNKPRLAGWFLGETTNWPCMKLTSLPTRPISPVCVCQCMSLLTSVWMNVMV